MKKLLILINCLILMHSLFVPAFAAEAEEEVVKTKGSYYDIEAPDYETEIALLVNADTDAVIYSKNADKITAPASFTKIVTALVVLDECKNLNKKVTCSYDAVHSLDGTGSSVAGLLADEKISVEMLLYCLFLPSANDAAAVLAEEFGDGKTENFIKKMNTYVKDLGCKNTHFANAHGLDDETVKGFKSDTQNRTTASDMYLIAKKALENQKISEIVNTYEVKIPKTNKSEARWKYNINPLINNYSEYYYEEAEGLITGSTDKAGACLVSSAEKNGFTYISIVMQGETNRIIDGKAYNTAFLMCRYMLRWAFNNIKMEIIADDNYILGEVGVRFGRGADYVGLVPKSPVSTIIHEDLTIDDLTLKLSDSFPETVDSPIEKGESVGKAQLMYKDVVVADVELVALQTVKKNYLWAMFNWIEAIATSKAFLIVLIVVAVVIIVLWLGTKNQRKRKKRRKQSVDIVKDYSKLAK